MLDRSRALQILGLAEDSDAREIRAAFAALRSHVEGRVQAAESDAAREARREELRDLERDWRSLSALPVPVGSAPPNRDPKARRPLPRWILGWAVVVSGIAVTGIAALLIARLIASESSFGPLVLVDGGAGGEGGGSAGGFAIDGEGEDAAAAGGSAIAEDAGPRARLVARSEIEGALLEIRSRSAAAESAAAESTAVVAEGAADDSVYWLAPGAYAVEVRHPDCRDAWEKQIDVSGGEELRLAPSICTETGWMVVRSNVPDDAFSIDGESRGSTGERKHVVAAGEHEVRVEKNGYRAWEGIVEVEPGQVLGIRPRLARVSEVPTKPARTQQVASARAEADEDRKQQFAGWHEDARRWLLSRYDLDRSGALDSRQELASVPCDHWLGLEQSYDQSNLGLPLTRFYGFDGDGWRSGALGVSDEARDLAYEQMKTCGLR